VNALMPTREAADLLGLPESRLRYWAQTGFIGPSVRQKGRFYYTFGDLVALKVARTLLDGGVSLPRVRANLEALRRRLPDLERPLAQLRICSDGEELVVIDDEAAWQPASGQLVMSFALRQLREELGQLRHLRPDTEPDGAYACFTAGLAALEAGDEARAEAHLRRALELDPALAAAWTDLGVVLERRGDRAGARAAFEKALVLDPEQPEARFDLANLLLDAGETELALAEYRRVAAAAPELADVHFNLALALLTVGAAAQAGGHLRRYLELDPASPWADDARALLTR
jgi:tetratricopeptide (TPR) repeat protein